jgi:hypothetical protein
MHTNRLITRRPITALFWLFMSVLLAPNLSPAQAPVAAWLESYRPSGDFRPVGPFRLATARGDLSETVENATLLSPDPAALDELLHVAPATLTFQIPTADGSLLELELVKVEILAPGFHVSTDAQASVPYHPAAHYRGIVRGDDHSVAALSVTSTGLSGMVADLRGTFEIGKMEDGSEEYIFYKKSDLKSSFSSNCHTEDESLLGDDGSGAGAEDRGVGCKTVQVYFECDYKMYTDKGSSTANVTNYVTSLFNQVATLYANENVGIAISQIYVWTTSDPYTSQGSTGGALNVFRQTRGTNFNGNLAHLLTTRSLGGGIAYVDVICFKQYAFGVSAISNSFQNVPTYSWSVEVVTHELGHNLGSWHTHSCNWPTGALDNCVSPEGSCSPGPAPTNGGTIMSYCHLGGYGINFNNGFGPTPGAHIRNKVLNASCLPSSGTAPTSLAASNVTGASATLSWGAVTGATSYTVQYKTAAASAWTTAGNSSAPTYNLSGLTANTAYNWQVKADCSNYSATANFTTNNSSGGGGSGGGGTTCNPPTGLIATNINTSSAVLSWASVSSATSYTVQYKVGSATNWTTAGTTATSAYNLSGLSSSTTYNWKVKANCSDYSVTVSFTTANASGGGGGTCSPPATLNNNSVGSRSAVISWSPVAGAANYILQIKLASSNNYYTLGTVPTTQVTISGLQPNTAYHWRVKASCSTWSAAKLLATLPGLVSEGVSELTEMSISFEEPRRFEIFPNPSSDFININFASENLAETQVFVSNATGHTAMAFLSGQVPQPLDVSALPAGVYFIHLMENGRRVASERFVKIK